MNDMSTRFGFVGQPLFPAAHTSTPALPILDAFYRRLLALAFLLVSLVSFRGMAATHYVDQNSPNPTAPYTNWPAAARNIQDAVDVSRAGDTVLVTDGTYASGGGMVSGALTSRVAITNAITLLSVNGPDVTAIQGYQVPGTTVGDSAVRCVYLGDGAVLSGFTLTGRATRADGDPTLEESGGGLLCASWTEIATNCVITGNMARGFGGGVCSTIANPGTLNNCTISANTSLGNGGGTYGSAVNNCLLANNSAADGGGAMSCLLSNCVVTGNSCAGDGARGGGAQSSTLINCQLIGNAVFGESSWSWGGGAAGCSLWNCLVANNSVSGSSAFGGGGGMSDMYNCTLIGNSADSQGGGDWGGTLINCIAYYNIAAGADNNYNERPPFEATLLHNCTTPLPTYNAGNFTNEPAFMDMAGGDFHLRSNSPCINAGRNDYAQGVDLDGYPRISGGTVDVGAYEYQSPTSVISYAWLQQYGLPTDGSADYADPDGDGMNNWQEWICGTDPTDAGSVLKLLAPSVTNNPPRVVIIWRSVIQRNYFLERATNLAGPGSFSVVATNLPGLAGTTSYTDTNAPGPGPFLYRVGVSD